jgi:hypothetical protein
MSTATIEADGENLRVTVTTKRGVARISQEIVTIARDGYRRVMSGPWSTTEPRADVDIVTALDPARIFVERREPNGTVRLGADQFQISSGEKQLVKKLTITTDNRGNPLTLEMESTVEAGAAELTQRLKGTFRSDALVAIDRPTVEPVLVISSTLPWSSGATDAGDMIRAIDLAIDDWQPRNGWQVKHVAIDSSAAPDEDTFESYLGASTAAAFMASDPSVVANIGPAFSDTSADVIKSTCGWGLLVILPHGPRVINSDLEGRRVNGDEFAYCAADEHNAVQLDAAVESRGDALAMRLRERRFRRIWSISDNGAGAAIMQRVLDEAGIKFEGVTVVRELGGDLAAQARTIVRADPDAVIYLGLDGYRGYQLWHDVMKRLPNAHYLATSNAVVADEDLREGLEKIGVLEVSEMDASAQEFASKYLSRYGSKPEYWARFAYDAANIVLQSLDAGLEAHADSTADDLRSWIRRDVTSQRLFSGSIHDWSFTRDGFPVNARLSVLRYERGSWKAIEPLEVAAPQ